MISSSPTGCPQAASPSAIASWTTPGKTYKAAHYDHGNGLAIADVDGDGRTDVYFANQVGGNRALEERRRRQVREHHRIGWRRRPRQGQRVGRLRRHRQRWRRRSLRHHRARWQRAVRERRQGPLPRHHRRRRSGLRRPFVIGSCFSTTTAMAGWICCWSTSAGTRRRRPRPRAIRKYYVAFEDAFAGHLKPARAERSILYRNEGGNRFVDVSKRHGADGPLLDRRRQPGRRQRRWLSRRVPHQHAGRRPVLRERRRHALRQEEPPGVSAHVLGVDGHQGVRRQQRRASRHLRHRHAFRHEPADSPPSGTS